jgi:transcription initiation factor TFIIIB Brf1 subunit/transcription initiation factor TFIIB
MNTTESILNAMKKAGKPLKAGEIAELSGIDKKEVEKGMKQLQKEDKIASPKRCFWEPK